MLEFSVKFMQTVDDMDANELYSGREEIVLPFVAARYPHTITGIQPIGAPKSLYYTRFVVLTAIFSNYGRLEMHPLLRDPFDAFFCQAFKGNVGP
jgi:hypothetical protein